MAREMANQNQAGTTKFIDEAESQGLGGADHWINWQHAHAICATVACPWPTQHSPGTVSSNIVHGSVHSDTMSTSGKIRDDILDILYTSTKQIPCANHIMHAEMWSGITLELPDMKIVQENGATDPRARAEAQLKLSWRLIATPALGRRGLIDPQATRTRPTTAL